SSNASSSNNASSRSSHSVSSSNNASSRSSNSASNRSNASSRSSSSVSSSNNASSRSSSASSRSNASSRSSNSASRRSNSSVRLHRRGPQKNRPAAVKDSLPARDDLLAQIMIPIKWTGATMAVSLPKQWEDWCSWLLGLWLCISPWALLFDLDATATKIAVSSGVLVILAELLTLTAFRAWEEWINVILGAWLIVCPWIVGISSSTAKKNFVVIGGLIGVLALYEIWTARRQSG